MDKMFVYVSGRYSAGSKIERDFNVETAQRVGVLLEQKGFHAVVPHLSHYIDIQAKCMGVDISYEKWIEHGLEQLSMCDAMLVISESPGVKREIEFANKHQIPIYYRIEDIKPEYCIDCNGEAAVKLEDCPAYKNPVGNAEL